MKLLAFALLSPVLLLSSCASNPFSPPSPEPTIETNSLGAISDSDPPVPVDPAGPVAETKKKIRA